MCNLIEYQKPIPVQYQIFDSLSNITNEDELARFGGHVILADYCPYNQELAYKNSNRDSRCYKPENQPPNVENYAVERYSIQSKCFDHSSIWEQYIEQCRRKRRIIPQAAGCYEFECVSSKGIYVHIGPDKYLCEYHGQNLSIITMEFNSIYLGSIRCPDCQVICGSLKNFQCPSSSIIEQQQQYSHDRTILLDNLCEKLIPDNDYSKSDKRNRTSRILLLLSSYIYIYSILFLFRMFISFSF